MINIFISFVFKKADTDRTHEGFANAVLTIGKMPKNQQDMQEIIDALVNKGVNSPVIITYKEM